MYLDSRSYMIFQEIVDNSSATGKGLEEKFHLTRKQLSYSFDKINDYLRDNGHPEIKRLKTGYFMVPGPVAEQKQQSPSPPIPIRTRSGHIGLSYGCSAMRMSFPPIILQRSFKSVKTRCSVTSRRYRNG